MPTGPSVPTGPTQPPTTGGTRDGGDPRPGAPPAVVRGGPGPGQSPIEDDPRTGRPDPTPDDPRPIDDEPDADPPADDEPSDTPVAAPEPTDATEPTPADRRMRGVAWWLLGITTLAVLATAGWLRRRPG